MNNQHFIEVMKNLNIMNYKKNALLVWPIVKSRGKEFSEKFVIMLGIIFIFVGVVFLILALLYPIIFLI